MALGFSEQNSRRGGSAADAQRRVENATRRVIYRGKTDILAQVRVIYRGKTAAPGGFPGADIL